jgi:hypothetical protein
MDQEHHILRGGDGININGRYQMKQCGDGKFFQDGTISTVYYFMNK